MIKGDLRKKQILEVAESLFAEKGYEATSVQDILDKLQLSKGSFYHHFESKAMVLQLICENRAHVTAQKISEESFCSGLEKMNCLISHMMPFHGEGLAFLKMILPVFTLQEGKSIRAGYQDALKNCLMPMMIDAFQEMIHEGSGYSFFVEETAGIILDLVNDLWAKIGQEMIMSEKTIRQSVPPSQLLSMVEPYRTAIENLLSAPYGSILIISLEELTSVISEIHDWWKVGP